ncbi:MAG TPA: hypothetical protein VEL74_24440 [Thermoanaerobaculia bacterium]|nr:hypothetical protein [Thermoanaerobaculia bacterium]
MLGELPPAETLEVLLHLLPGCPRCQEITSVLWAVGTEPPASGTGSEGWWSASGRFAYEGTIEQVFAGVRQAYRALERERAEAPPLLEELLAERLRTREEGSLWAASIPPRLRTWGLCELLLRQSQDHRADDPRRAAALAELAVVVAGGLDPSLYPPPVLETLRARTWGALGNIRRILSDFRGAEEAFGQAEIHLARGGDVVEKGVLLDLQASLRLTQGRTAEATRLLDRAMLLFRRLGQRHLLGRAMISKGYVRICAGDSGPAVELLRQGLALADPGHEPRLVLAAQHCLAYLLYEGGRPEEARHLLERNRRLYLEHGDRLDLVRLRYLEGKIAAVLGGAGERSAAEEAFREVREVFAEAGLALDAALASLDLAALYVEQGRAAEVHVLAGEMLAIFRSREVSREAMAALILFCRAAEARDVTASLVQEVTAQLRQVRRSE